MITMVAAVPSSPSAAKFTAGPMQVKSSRLPADIAEHHVADMQRQAETERRPVFGRGISRPAEDGLR